MQNEDLIFVKYLQDLGNQMELFRAKAFVRTLKEYILNEEYTEEQIKVLKYALACAKILKDEQSTIIGMAHAINSKEHRAPIKNIAFDLYITEGLQSQYNFVRESAISLSQMDIEDNQKLFLGTQLKLAKETKNFEGTLIGIYSGLLILYLEKEKINHQTKKDYH